MSNRFLRWLKSAISFGQNVVGTIQIPYQTYRSIAFHPDGRHIILVAILVSIYLTVSTLVRGGLRASPLFLTASFSKVALGAFFSYLGSCIAIFLLGKLSFFQSTRATSESERYNLRIAVLWAYTLIPTILWFLTMSLFYHLLPPPRTNALLGQIASAFFIALSIALLFWKVILYYLTLRFGLRLTLGKIMLFSFFFLPILLLYAAVMFRMNIFRVPFL